MLLQMDKRTRELNEALVEGEVRSLSICQPQFLQHVMRLVEKSAVETLEVAEVVGIQVVTLAPFDQGGDLCALPAHIRSVSREA